MSRGIFSFHIYQDGGGGAHPTPLHPGPIQPSIWSQLQSSNHVVSWLHLAWLQCYHSRKIYPQQDRQMFSLLSMFYIYSIVIIFNAKIIIFLSYALSIAALLYSGTQPFVVYLNDVFLKWKAFISIWIHVYSYQQGFMCWSDSSIHIRRKWDLYIGTFFASS